MRCPSAGGQPRIPDSRPSPTPPRAIPHRNQPTATGQPQPCIVGSIPDVTQITSPTLELRVLVYSDSADTRSRVLSALGTRPHPDLPTFHYAEVATAAVVIEHMDAGGIGLAILDGEAAPTGGLGLAKQFSDELDTCPPILVLTGRPDDKWLADWSRADAAVPHPIDPLRLREAVTVLLRAV